MYSQVGVSLPDVVGIKESVGAIYTCAWGLAVCVCVCVCV